MWPDNETERDFLNFSGIADTVAEIVVQARGRPVSVGVSGAWGVGKSSMIKLIQASLADCVDRQNVTSRISHSAEAQEWALLR